MLSSRRDWFVVLVLPCIAGSLSAQGYAPEHAASKMTVADGLNVQLVAAEPLVRQPVAIDFDERGRLWVLQYLQYPNPEGLKRVKVDRFSRTIYDRLPEPPPRGPKGADRLTILEPDPANPGSLKAKDFVAGLNLASGFAFGHGGVFVLQVPYLLYYPDRNRDDVPDGDPDVLLTGFGMEDAHSVANSLTWGPDGWLYGCQGSTVTANIRGIEFQQGVWRYHPITRKFELFCEGGGNSWGLDFDRHGQLLFSTNHGGFVMLHGVQGGYYWKSFGKHGALHNPHAFGYFDHVPHENFRGGHVTVGGIVYRGDNFPARFRDRYIGADLLGHAVRWHEIEPNGSTFKTRNGGELLVANDTWCAPSDVCLGPDGCVYVADWHDARMAHPDPDAEWDRRNGRIYRIAHGQASALPAFDLATKSSAELLKLLGHPNDWYARTARRILADRRDPEVILPLRTRVRGSADDSVLQSLWALYVSGGCDESFCREMLGHRNEHVRRWAVRFLGDETRIAAGTADALARLAVSEPSVNVRSQLACTARRLPAKAAVAIVLAITKRSMDGADPHVPLLLWWAVERHTTDSGAWETEFSAPEVWKSPLARAELIPRLVRRFAAAGNVNAEDACLVLFNSAPDAAARRNLWEAIGLGLRELPAGQKVRGGFARWLHDFDRRGDGDPVLTHLLARMGMGDAADRVRAEAFDRTRPLADRVAAISTLADPIPVDTRFRRLDLRPEGSPSTTDFLALALRDDQDAVRVAALAAWARDGTAAEADELIAAYAKLPAAIRPRARAVLLSRRAWAARLLRDVDPGRIPAQDFTADELFMIVAHKDKDLDALVRKHWGNVRSATPEEKLAEVRRFNNDLRAAAGDAKNGRTLFTKHCGACHKLHGEGGTLGPDLTHANRSERDYLLVSLVDPNAVVRKEYTSYIAETKANQLITGIITSQTPTLVTLTNAKAEALAVRRADIVSLRESSVSIMPEGLLNALKPQELRDLFAYLQLPKVKP